MALGPQIELPIIKSFSDGIPPLIIQDFAPEITFQQVPQFIWKIKLKNKIYRGRTLCLENQVKNKRFRGRDT